MGKSYKTFLVLICSHVYQSVRSVVVHPVGGGYVASGNVGRGGMPFNFGESGGVKAFLQNEVVELLP